MCSIVWLVNNSGGSHMASHPHSLPIYSGVDQDPASKKALDIAPVVTVTIAVQVYHTGLGEKAVFYRQVW